MFSSDLACFPGFAVFLSGQQEPFLSSPAVSALLSLQAPFSQGYGLTWGEGRVGGKSGAYFRWITEASLRITEMQSEFPQAEF